MKSLVYDSFLFVLVVKKLYDTTKKNDDTNDSHGHWRFDFRIKFAYYFVWNYYQRNTCYDE